MTMTCITTRLTIPAMAIVVALSTTARAQSAIPLPAVAGPVAVTTTSYPFLAANRLQEPVDLAKIGYVEEEFFVSGRANVYDWAQDGTLSVKTPNAPYTTRILVRRPANPAQFSGSVVVELIHAPSGNDFPEMFSWSGDYVFQHHDAYVGITMDPMSIKALQKFNAARYAPLSMANPNPTEACAAGGRGNAEAATSDSEEGLKWDVITQVGALLKSNAPLRLLAGFNVQYLYMTSQDAAQTTYINAIGPHAKLANGKPVYDGHVIKSGGRPARIRRCAQAPGAGDPRAVVKNAGVPVINVLQEGDVLGALTNRRADSDAPGDQYRWYEVAGTAHSSPPPYRTAVPVAADLMALGPAAVVPHYVATAIAPYTLEQPLKDPERCANSEMVTEQPILMYIFHGAYDNLDQWVRKGTPAPKASRIETKDVGGKTVITMDDIGNNLGGIRSPYVDEPTRIYHTGHGQGPGCGNNFGYSEPLNWARLDALYGGYKNYAAKVSASIDKLLKDRWVTASDAQRIRAELLAPPTPSNSSN
jgi:hypothetical protein